MKKVLLVDSIGSEYYKGYCDIAHWEKLGVLEFREAIRKTKHIDASQYRTAFIHQSDRREYEWAKRNFDPVFIFSESRDTDHYIHKRRGSCQVFLERKYFRSRLEGVLNHYVETSKLIEAAFDPEADQSESKRKPVGTRKNDSKSVATTSAEVITFTHDIDQASHSDNHFLIRYGEDHPSGIDIRQTLEPLANLEGPLPIYLEEQYDPDRAGLREGLIILLRIRLAAAFDFKCYRWPIYIRICTPLSSLLRTPLNAIVGSEGVTIVTDSTQIPGAQVASLKASQVVDTLKSLPFRPEAETSNHELSNEWGVLRLAQGLQMLRGQDQLSLVWSGLQERLLSRLYYNYLLALSSLTEGRGVDEQVNLSNLKYGYDLWIAFLERHVSSPLKILLIDDEADSPGQDADWRLAIELLFEDVPGSVELEVYSGQGMFSYKSALSKAKSENWDLVLCDLLLSSQDSEISNDSDPTRKQDYTGLKLIREIKDDQPATAVIAFTASDKAWTARALRQHGTDGYWIKENPVRGVNNQYTLENAGDLLQQIDRSVSKYEKYSFLSDLIRDLEQAQTQRAFLEHFESLPDSDVVSERLSAIKSMLLNAFRVLHEDTSDFYMKLSGHEPHASGFLYIWACLNEILPLRIERGPNKTNKKCRLLTNEGPRIYWDTSNGWEGQTPWTKEIMSSFGRMKLYPYEDKPEKQGRDTAYVSFIFASHKDGLYDDYSRCKEHRNNLEVIHGDIVRSSSKTTEVLHLKRIINLVRSGLFL